MTGFDTAECPLIAGYVYDKRGAGDRWIEEMARDLASRGVRLAGLIQLPPRDPESLCDITVELLSDGRQIDISERRGKLAKGCRLDSGALEVVAAAVEAMLPDKPDLLVLSKFARREAEGHGLRQAVEKAMLAGIPVVIGVPKDYYDAFCAFADGLALLTFERTDIEDWWRAVSARRTAAT